MYYEQMSSRFIDEILLYIKLGDFVIPFLLVLILLDFIVFHENEYERAGNPMNIILRTLPLIQMADLSHCVIANIFCQ